MAAILDAAIRVLGEKPEASIGDIAEAAGVTRQTVYAHYASREGLISAVIDRVTEEVVAMIDAAEVDRGAPAAALLRLLNAGWLAFERYPFLSHIPPLSPEESHDHHQPILQRLERLIRRGQRTGDFNPQLSSTWLLAATIGLAHTAAEEVSAGRMTAEDATKALHDTVLRVFGVAAVRSSSAPD